MAIGIISIWYSETYKFFMKEVAMYKILTEFKILLITKKLKKFPTKLTLINKINTIQQTDQIIQTMEQ